jgi:hypothetical protein
MPSLINSQCPQLHDHYVRAWVYGHLKAPDAEYFVVDGSVRLESGDRPGVFSTVQEEGYGFLVEVRGAKCLVDPTPYIFFPEATKERGLKSTIRISESVLDDISADLLRRYAKAFGGKKSFLRRVTQQQREELPPVLRQQLKLFEKNPNM